MNDTFLLFNLHLELEKQIWFINYSIFHWEWPEKFESYCIFKYNWFNFLSTSCNALDSYLTYMIFLLMSLLFVVIENYISVQIVLLCNIIAKN